MPQRVREERTGAGEALVKSKARKDGPCGVSSINATDPRDIVAKILWETSMDPSEKAAKIVRQLPYLHEAKVASVVASFIIPDASHDAKLRDANVKFFAGHILEKVTTTNMHHLFKCYLLPGLSKYPIVHCCETAGRSTAIDRHDLPFATNGFIDSLSDAGLPPDPSKVRVLHGESGIGKTHHALASNPDGIVVYLLFDTDFHLAKNANVKPGPVTSIPSADINSFEDGVLEKCAKAFAAHGPKVDKKCSWVAEQMAKLHVRLLVDELGSKPNLIRLFINHRASIQNRLRQQDSELGWHGCKSVDIVLVGTGINLLAAELGFSPDAYTTEQVAPAPISFFQDLVKYRWRGPYPHPILALDLETPGLEILGSLIQNRRAAVIAATFVASIMELQAVDNAANMMRVLRHAIGVILYNVAVEYKVLSALQDFTPPELRGAALEAFSLAMPQQKRREPTVQQPSRYVATLGLLEKDNGSGGSAGAHQSEPDLHMSAAVRLILLSLIGFSEVATLSSGSEGLARLVALKCVLAMMTTSNSSTLHQMLHTAPLRRNKSKWPIGEATVKFDESKEHSATSLIDEAKGVAFLVLDHQLAGLDDDVKATLNAINAHVQNGGAVVVLNEPGAPYADVIAVRKGFLGFFRVKDTEVFDGTAEAMNLSGGNSIVTKSLLDIAKVTTSDTGVVVVSPQRAWALQRVTRGVPWYGVPLESDFLFPFFWPTKGLGESDRIGKVEVFFPPK